MLPDTCVDWMVFCGWSCILRTLVQGNLNSPNFATPFCPTVTALSSRTTILLSRTLRQRRQRTCQHASNVAMGIFNGSGMDGDGE